MKPQGKSPSPDDLLTAADVEGCSGGAGMGAPVPAGAGIFSNETRAAGKSSGHHDGPSQGPLESGAGAGAGSGRSARARQWHSGGGSAGGAGAEPAITTHPASAAPSLPPASRYLPSPAAAELAAAKAAAEASFAAVELIRTSVERLESRLDAERAQLVEAKAAVAK